MVYNTCIDVFEILTLMLYNNEYVCKLILILSILSNIIIILHVKYPGYQYKCPLHIFTYDTEDQHTNNIFYRYAQQMSIGRNMRGWNKLEYNRRRRIIDNITINSGMNVNKNIKFYVNR